MHGDDGYVDTRLNDMQLWFKSKMMNCKWRRGFTLQVRMGVTKTHESGHSNMNSQQYELHTNQLGSVVVQRFGHIPEKVCADVPMLTLRACTKSPVTPAHRDDTDCSTPFWRGQGRREGYRYSPSP